jgi:uncharacterized membrane protein
MEPVFLMLFAGLIFLGIVVVWYMVFRKSDDIITGLGKSEAAQNLQQRLNKEEITNDQFNLMIQELQEKSPEQTIKEFERFL